MVRLILSWTLWPLAIVILLASILYFSDLASPQSIGATTGRTFGIAFGALVVLEVILPYRRDWAFRGDRDVLRDLGHFILYTQLGRLGAQLLVLAGYASLLGPLDLPVLWPTEASLVLQVLLVMFLGDGLEYWLHRLAHALPALWSVHAIHHMPTRLNMFKAGRHHILYFLWRGLVVWVPLLLLGAPPDLIVWQIVAVGLTGNIAHANVDFRIPGFMHRVLVTPQFHRIHHSADPAEGNSNFSVMLPIWDIAFGTHTDPLTTEVRSMGIEGDPIPHRLLPELLSPFSVKRWKN